MAVSHANVTQQAELAHLRRLAGHETLASSELDGNFVRLRGAGYTLKWERHSEFTRYSLVQTLSLSTQDESIQIPDLLTELALPTKWLAGIPGQTVAAIQMIMVAADLRDPPELMRRGQRWFGEHALLVSRIGEVHSWAVTDFRLSLAGFVRLLVFCDPAMSQTLAGRLSQHLLELETYRLMALCAVCLWRKSSRPCSASLSKSCRRSRRACKISKAQIKVCLTPWSRSRQRLSMRLLSIAIAFLPVTPITAWCSSA